MKILTNFKQTDNFFYPLILAFITLILFLPNLQNNFVNWDDYNMILLDPSNQELSFANTFQIFKDHLTLKYSRVVPLAYLSYSLEHHFFGFNPVYFHLTNNCLHTLNVVLVFFASYLLTQNSKVAFCTALLFAIHPINLEPVAWLSARAHILFLTFYLISLITYLKYLSDQRCSKILFILSLLAFLGSLLACGFAITLPIILLLLDGLYGRPMNKIIILEKIPFFLLSGLFIILAVLAAHYSSEIIDPYISTRQYSVPDRILLSCGAFVFYIGKLFIPFQLCVVYPIGIFAPQRLLLWTLTGTLILLIFICFRFLPSDRLSRFCLLFFLITTIPFLHFYSVADTFLSERYMYLPSISFFCLLSLSIQKFYNRQKSKLARVIILIIFGFYCLSLTTSTLRRIHVWNNTAALWTDVINQFPRALPAYQLRGEYYLSIKEYNLAINDFNYILERDPQNTTALRKKEIAIFNKSLLKHE
jgi:hypothetical protein